MWHRTLLALWLLAVGSGSAAAQDDKREVRDLVLRIEDLRLRVEPLVEDVREAQDKRAATRTEQLGLNPPAGDQAPPRR